MYRAKDADIRLSSVRNLWMDLLLLAVFLVFLYFFVSLARHWIAPLETNVTIDLSIGSLPKYSFYSLIRALIAYSCSLFFTLVVGHLAAKNKTAEKIILPLLDICQSIPVVGFLPGLVLGLIAVFPKNNLGLELACIIMIFTGQVWNMTFSYYASLKSVPTQFHELAKILNLSWTKKLVTIELPYSFTNLVWNSLMSMAGGWFFLTICESFSLSERNFVLPGLGSYMKLAIERQDSLAMWAGVLSMILVIIFFDFLFWRPILAWSQKFRLEDAQDQTKDIPFVMLLLKDSNLVKWFIFKFDEFSLWRTSSKNSPENILPKPTPLILKNKKTTNFIMRIAKLKRLVPDIVSERLPQALILALLLFGMIYVYELVRPLSVNQWKQIGLGTLATTLRVVASIVLASLWAIPVGIWIGSSPKLTRFFQPIVQVAASFPAPMLYPLVMLILSSLHIGFGFGSMFLMLLGVQWYVLFNVLAGASTISLELRDTVNLMGLSRISKWKNLYLPSVFPATVTGWVTSAGGAWNASIVAEYFQYGGKTLSTLGLGAMISKATDTGDFAMLTGCLLVMCTTVIGLNRSLWHQLYSIAENRFKYDK